MGPSGKYGLASDGKTVNAVNLLYLGLFASALCFLTWNRVVEILGAVKSSVYIYMVPVVAVVASAIILGERLTWISLAGILLTLFGVTISEYRKKHGKAGRKGHPERNLIFSRSGSQYLPPCREMDGSRFQDMPGL